ncbi:hypothetical protein B7L66_25310 (plasmid) [Xanthomonas citri pv. citri]|nr:hypothetical protein B7L66_25310 [Xanthomonas citri pv. citri]QYF37954.1 hypothetical protein HZS91_05040 [Xanthomonas citri pv. citri]QYF47382.1 hypothetical protein HZS93_06066 [Xanthomonas citri]
MTSLFHCSPNPKHHWLASGSVYGHRKIAKDLRDLGERCSRHRVHRLMRTEGLRAQVRGGRDLCKKQPKVG